ncbi:MAG: Zn-ribbon domain-containing OB-fold protein [Thermoplasmata archaeon]|nr:Zn-ribbon domain-containing OB-fold protein [Thermoplasmata archaeon]
MVPKPKTFTRFRELQAEIVRSGAAIYRDAEGTESLIIDYPYSIRYIHSYAEDSPFFLALANGELKGSKCTDPACGFVFATPRSHCMVCGHTTKWITLPLKGKVHSWTTCHFGSEAFLKETPYNLALVEFDGAGSLLMARLKDCVESEIYIGMPIEARFDASPKFSIADIWFVPSKEGAPKPGASRRTG